MRRAVSILFIILLSLSAAVQAAALDLDDLFGGDLLQEMEEGESVLNPEEALLVGLDLGGDYNFSLNASRVYLQDNNVVDSFNAQLRASLFLDARPNPDFRVLGKAGLTYQTEGDAKLSLLELFSDFNYKNKVFFRAGKQNVEWGMGYFFKPAHVLNTGKKAPLALKIHYPQRSNNYYLYLFFDDLEKLQELAWAPKMEFVWGRAEVGLGAFFKQDAIPRAMATISSSLGDLSLFAEASVSKGSDNLFLEGEQLVEKDGFFVKATVGGAYQHSDPKGLFNLGAMGQYYYDGEGLGEGGLVLKPAWKHNLALVLSWHEILKSRFSLSTSWQSNLSGKQGTIMTTLSLPSWGQISPSVGFNYIYGEELASSAAIFAAVTLGSGSF